MKPPLVHTNDPLGCFLDEIRSIADYCDQEYYMSAMGPSHGTVERAKRGRSRLLEGIADLEAIRRQITCPACRLEVEDQINIQTKGIIEIENAWNLGE